MDEDTLLLIKKAQKGDGAALSKIVEADMPLVKYALSRRVYPGEYADLFQTGALGLIKAVLRFDPTRGTGFSTYAYACISGELKHSARRVSVKAALSLDFIGTERGISISEKLTTDCAELERIENEVFAEQAISSLPETEGELVRLRYYRGLTQREAGRILGISQPQVSRIERKVFLKLRGILPY